MKKLIFIALLFISTLSFGQTWSNTGSANLQRAPTSKGYIYRNNMGALGNVTWYTQAQLDSLFSLVPTTGSTLLKVNNLSDVANATTALANLNGVSTTTFNTTTGTSTQTQINSKQSTITLGTTPQYFRGDLSLATFPTSLPTPNSLIFGYGLTPTGSFNGSLSYTINIDTSLVKSKAGFNIDYNNLAARFGGYVPISRTLTINGVAFDLSANRSWTVGSGNLTASNFVFNETPTGTVNGSNVTFTLGNTPTAGTVRLYKNGLRLAPSEYSISGLTITYSIAPSNAGFTDVLLADYLK
ncbi:MAG: hypothetical protein JWQ09_5867 [Segetibacter sp.]|nr:hypothetical protein [Segetibacter sp.]